MPSTALREKREELRVKQEALHQIWEKAGPDLDLSKVDSLTGDTQARIDHVKGLDKELTAVFDEIKSLEEVEKMAGADAERMKYLKDPVHGMQHPNPGSPETKDGPPPTMGKLFMESKAYEAFRAGQQGLKSTLDIDLKAVFRTGAGWDPEVIRLPRVELDPQRPIAIVDNIPMFPTGRDTIAYMEETTFTNNAAETAESTATTAADLIGEAALALTERTRPVEWLPVFLPVTQQQMEDVDGIEDYVNGRLAYMLRARLDSQIIAGDGSTPNILGTNNVSGINTQAKGTDPTPDAVFKGMQLVRSVGFAEPSVIFVHPDDWTDIRLLRTADGIYIYGGPMDDGPTRMWGVPVVQSAAVTENTITLGDYRNFSALYNRRGVTIEVSNSHAYYFTRGMLAVRADMRVSLVHFRPEAFCTVTGV